MPSADFSHAVRVDYSPLSSARRQSTWETSRGKTQSLPRVDAGFIKHAPLCRWRASRSRARSPRRYHTSYPVPVRRPALLDWASFRPRLTTMPLPFSLPSARRKPGVGAFTPQVLCHARHTRRNQRWLEAIRWIVLCTPGMGVNLWGESPLYMNPVNG